MTADELERPIEAELPPVGLMVLAQCDGFCCLACRTAEQKWISAFTHEELDNVIGVLPY